MEVLATKTLKRFINFLRQLFGREYVALHKYNLKASILDGLEEIFDHAAFDTSKNPMSVDMRDELPAAWDQGDEGSCTAHAGCAARVHLLGDKTFDPSRAFQYWNEQEIEGDPGQDNGAQMKTIGTAMKKYGVCSSADMPYIDGRTDIAPTAQDYKDGLKYKIDTYTRVAMSVAAIQTALAQHHGVLCGMKVYQSMESAAVEKSGVLPMPKSKEQLLGRHAVYIVGYVPTLPSDVVQLRSYKRMMAKMPTEQGYFIVRNSWGTTWGQAGYFYMPYSYIGTRYANEFWLMKNKVTNTIKPETVVA
jgi:C1A family cysteine protease